VTPAGDVRRGAERAAGGEAARRFVLAGWAAKGVVYVALAWLVLQLARGPSASSTDTTGALELIDAGAGGSLALYVLAVGLVAYALGRILEVTTLATSDMDAKEKAQAVVVSIVYLALAATAVTVAGRAGSGGGGSGGGGGEQRGTAVLLDLPAGRLLVGLLGLAGLALGAYSAYKGVTEGFLPTLRTGEMSPTVRTWSTRLGVAAYVTRGLIFGLIGWFLLQAAITYDADEAVGLDGALRRVADAGWGRALLAAIAAGLLAYGLFCWLEARYRKVGVSAGGTT
jgi:hypothetical protein